MVGVVVLNLIMGMCEKSVKFQVVNILDSFNFLLGRPWIHGLDGVASSLHQKMKFITSEN